MKKDYEIYSAIKNNSGFGWDDQRGIPTAPESVWCAYLTAHPEAERFRGRALIHYSILHVLCTNLSTTGEFTLTYSLSNYPHSATSSQASQPPKNLTVLYPTTQMLANSESKEVRQGGGRDSSEEEGQAERQEEQGIECRERRTAEEERSQQSGGGIEVAYGGGREGESRTVEGRKRNQQCMLDGMSNAEEGKRVKEDLQVGKKVKAELGEQLHRHLIVLERQHKRFSSPKRQLRLKDFKKTTNRD